MAVSSESGEKLLTAIFLSSLMIFLGIAAATDALIDDNRTTLHEKDTVNDVILHVSQLNEPGSQEGSIFTDTTLSSGNTHTCASSTTVMCRAGDAEPTASWVMCNV